MFNKSVIVFTLLLSVPFSGGALNKEDLKEEQYKYVSLDKLDKKVITAAKILGGCVAIGLGACMYGCTVSSNDNIAELANYPIAFGLMTLGASGVINGSGDLIPDTYPTLKSFVCKSSQIPAQTGSMVLSFGLFNKTPIGRWVYHIFQEKNITKMVLSSLGATALIGGTSDYFFFGCFKKR